MATHIDNREYILQSLRTELFGPGPAGEEIDCHNPLTFSTRAEAQRPHRQKGTGEEILTKDRPSSRYGVGVLYPPDDSNLNANQPEDIYEASENPFQDSIPDENEDFDLSTANLSRPRSIGLSFLIQVPEQGKMCVRVGGGRYTRLMVEFGDEGSGRPQKHTWWPRSAVSILAEVSSDLLLTTSGEVPVISDGTNLEGLNLRVRVISRPNPSTGVSSRLVTVCVVNYSNELSYDENCLFQVSLEVTFQAGEETLCCILPYPEATLGKPDEEELSISLLYRNSQTFAIGHGCSADWVMHPGLGNATKVIGDCLPVVEVPSVTPEIKRKDGTLMEVPMRDLVNLAGSPYGLKHLEETLALYSEWIADQEQRIQHLDPVYRQTAQVHLDQCRASLGRMFSGLNRVTTDPLVRRAFELTNHAMLLQQLRSRRIPRTPRFDSKSKTIVFSESCLPVNINQSVPNRGKWRPFQVAFILMTINSIVDVASKERDIVDLIWFPTGGGKTEAYLGLAAFTMFYRRLTNSSNTGVDVLMRYTLRLLTAQQFQRASALICAMEYVRREYSEELGSEEFSIGIWLGGDTTPNRRADALKALRDLNRFSHANNPFVLMKCPWCSAEFGRLKSKSSHLPVLGYTEQGGTVVFRCPDRSCDFAGGLPVYVIDEDVYDKRPTLVIGTVDKFAMLAWRSQARAIFGLSKDGARVVSPPSLIIQDELHLISGPLGSMTGLYEALINELCTSRRNEEEVKPKIVCSTATIRRYREQVRALFARNDARLFPAPGLESGDSFFACYARDDQGNLRRGKMYVGVNAPGLKSMQTAQVRSFSALVQAPLRLDALERDPWWTLLVFFNSLRELGTTLTLFQSDIPSYLKTLAQRLALSDVRFVRGENALELTGRRESDEIPKAIAALEREYNPTTGAVDVCLASNVIEVGVDIDRLSLMSVVGQPKTTAQYIQVTGRVGRQWWDRPGLVVTLYSLTKPRDRSHFEKFRSYHERLYAQVEPTSVTPFSRPVLERALHAILVGYVRQTGNEASAASPYPVPRRLLSEVSSILKQRIQTVDPAEVAQAEKVLAQRLKEWDTWQRTIWYRSAEIDDFGLLRDPGSYCTEQERLHSWSTPTSMRNVDSECRATITTLFLR